MSQNSGTSQDVNVERPFTNFPAHAASTVIVSLNIQSPPPFTGERTGRLHGYTWLLTHDPESRSAKYRAHIIAPSGGTWWVGAASEQSAREQAVREIERHVENERALFDRLNIGERFDGLG